MSKKGGLPVKYILVAAGLAILIGGGWLAARNRGIEAEKETVAPGPFEARVRARGEVRSTGSAQIFSEVDGQILSLPVREGDWVKAGQVLAVFDTAARRPARTNEIAVARAAAEGAEAAYQAARREVDRLKKLLDQGAVPAQQVDQARAEFEVRRSSYQSAQANLNLVSAGFSDLARPGAAPAGAVLAPNGGVVLDLPAREGMVIPRGTRLMSLGDPLKLEVIAEVAPSDLPKITEGQEADIFLEAGGPRTARGKVERILPQGVINISPLGVKQSRAQVKVRVTENVEWLKPGYQVENEIITARLPIALSIPESAIFDDKGAKYVFAVENNRAKLRLVQTGGRSSGRAEILEGISQGEVIIVRPPEGLKDGDRVR